MGIMRRLRHTKSRQKDDIVDRFDKNWTEDEVNKNVLWMKYKKWKVDKTKPVKVPFEEFAYAM